MLPLDPPVSKHSPRMLAITNAKAGTFGAHSDSVEYLQRACEGRVHSAGNDAQLAAALQQARDEQVERVILLGGDGTLARIINAMSGDFERFEVGVVPAGTGNDLARSLGLPLDQPLIAAQLACEGAARPIDLIRLSSDAEPIICLNAATGGLGGAVAAEVDSEQKSTLGKFAYWLSALQKLQEPPEFKIDVECDDRTVTVRALGMWVANGRHIGGGFTIAPQALIDDGHIDLMIVPALPFLELAATGMNFMLGGIEFAEQLIHARAKKASIRSEPPLPWSIDGEPSESRWLSCEVMPGALRVVTGNVNPALS